jgi:hypothetical protein
VSGWFVNGCSGAGAEGRDGAAAAKWASREGKKNDAGLDERAVADAVFGAGVSQLREGAGKFTLMSSSASSGEAQESGRETGGVRPRGEAKGEELQIPVS